ncbi:BA75_04633T0 [Komagataella pastoris]|uniref:BA75_04633T0 n=1 Tax=Komagataella pastoris TaxID=4922 RepID=A0A1B2JI55_PICPA|nr:BA75_04633T0 [Komagataella pastoris]
MLVGFTFHTIFAHLAGGFRCYILYIHASHSNDFTTIFNIFFFWSSTEAGPLTMYFRFQVNKPLLFYLVYVTVFERKKKRHEKNNCCREQIAALRLERST